jgi:hypothetical protein
VEATVATAAASAMVDRREAAVEDAFSPASFASSAAKKDI